MPEPAATRRDRPAAAPGTPPFWEIRWFSSIDSTNRYLLESARQGAPDGVVAVSDHQTAGRGRLGRSWVDAPGSSLLVSVLLRPALAPEDLGHVTAAAGLAMIDALRSVAGIDARLKWPNDLVVGDRKLAGLLAEIDLRGQGEPAVVVGLGCNVTAAAVPSGLDATVTACEIEAADPVDRSALLSAFLDALDARLANLDAVIPDARDASATLGRRVRVDLGRDRVLVGDAVAITDAGALVIRDDSGDAHTVAVGDVVHLRTQAR